MDSQNAMSVAALKILLHYYVTPLKLECNMRRLEYLATFLASGLLQERKGKLTNEAGEEYDEFEISDKGQFYVEALLATPFPQTKYFIPLCKNG